MRLYFYNYFIYIYIYSIIYIVLYIYSIIQINMNTTLFDIFMNDYIITLRLLIV